VLTSRPGFGLISVSHGCRDCCESLIVRYSPNALPWPSGQLSRRPWLPVRPASGYRVIGENKGLYYLGDVVGANPMCYPFCARDYPARRQQAPATRAYFRMSSERAFPTRGELWEKTVRRIHPSGACHEHVADSWQSVAEMTLAAGTALEEEPPAHAWPTSSLDRTSARRNQAGAFAGFR
jgi:hypothetical protein